jgi:TM2 domain-containing membrane protein YozV
MFGSVWAWSEGIGKIGGRLYVGDAIAATISALLFGYTNGSDLGLHGAIASFIFWRAYVGRQAKRWLTRDLVAKGYVEAASAERRTLNYTHFND